MENTMWSTHTVEYYSAKIKNEALTQAAVWMSERSQTPKVSCYMISFTQTVQNR